MSDRRWFGPARFQVSDSVDVVDDLFGVDVIEETVDGEVAAAGVLHGVAELVVVSDEQIVFAGTVAVSVLALVVCGRARIGAEGRCLDDLSAKEDVGQSETSTNDAAIAKQAAQLVGLRAGRYVEVFGLRPSSRSRTQPPTR